MRKTQRNKTQNYNISEHQIHKIANKHYYKTVICCNARSLTLRSSKINVNIKYAPTRRLLRDWKGIGSNGRILMSR